MVLSYEKWYNTFKGIMREEELTMDKYLEIMGKINLSNTEKEALGDEILEAPYQDTTKDEKTPQRGSKVPKNEGDGTIDKDTFLELMESESYEEILSTIGTSIDELSELSKIEFNFAMSPIRKSVLTYPRSFEFFDKVSEMYKERAIAHSGYI